MGEAVLIVRLVSLENRAIIGGGDVFLLFDDVINCPRPTCPRTLGCPVPRKTRPLNDASLTDVSRSWKSIIGVLVVTG